MLVRDRMSAPAITVEPKTSIYDALALMKERRIRRLPIVKGRRLVGIVTWTDLMRASPSPATSLTVWEIPYLLMKAPVAEVMTKTVITVDPSTTVEEAAVLMRRHKIGGMPVVEGGSVIGVITESDIFDAFIDLMGLRRGGARLTIELQDRIGALEEVVRTIRDCDVNIRSLAAYPLDGIGQVVVRVDTPYPLHLVQTLSEHGIKVTHLAPLPEAETGAA
ncbi:MAG: CBS domain-containing protein [Armatimonadota bacterium]|nr:CBS domain-containing protein [Armatimonadota bacterium]MDR7450537.1 CBS domain-containing protein [Armatimonadota bacterium]MDR7466330.1 CBS domain-containing protein [Armatimonadota bacterium]MDR7493051.1 CBS domain-containing protein [Armatimonadota bacterium]MDR7498192.1 CBS domain-containing protein [Armatimonadota bacterium]